MPTPDDPGAPDPTDTPDASVAPDAPGTPPADIRRLADARRDARFARDFAEADRLKAEIEAAGWTVVDQGTSYRLRAAHPADVVLDGRTRHGWSGSVPSRAAEAPTGLASVVLVATDRTDELERALAGLAGAVGSDVQRIVVANGPSPEQETALVEWERHWLGEVATAAGDPSRLAASTEIVWLASRLGAAAALNAGIRRATADVVILLDASVEVLGDIVAPLVRALSDPSVAVAGPWGLRSADQRHFEPATGAAGADGAAVAAVDLACLAFHRADHATHGPLDEQFQADALLGAWWSLVLRDHEDDAGVRRAVVVDVPAARAGGTAGDDRAERRNRYRLIDRFGNRTDLAVP